MIEVRTNESGRRICGAKKRNGDPCGCTILFPNGRCRIHGGPTPVGMASPAYRGGRHSRHLPTRLYEKYKEAQDDPVLLDLRNEVALMDVRIGELLERVESGDSAEIWARLKIAHADLRKAIFGEGDTQAVVSAVKGLQDLIDKGIGDWATWNEIGRVIEQRRKLVESERTHQKQMQQLVSVDQMMLLAGALLGSIKTHVQDRKALNAISMDFDRLLKAGA